MMFVCELKDAAKLWVRNGISKLFGGKKSFKNRCNYLIIRYENIANLSLLGPSGYGPVTQSVTGPSESLSDKGLKDFVYKNLR